MSASLDLRSGLNSTGTLRPQETTSQQPVALETAVMATGARPGDSSTKRELFTEETETVLVFENGAVIRLSAAVADGQLLFLTNKRTGKEVVSQVLRKRSFRPTACYVDLEFTEPCPDFWGIEFPKPAVTASTAADPDKTSSEKRSEIAARPATHRSFQEVDQLKHEVAALQTQIKLVSQTAPIEAADFDDKPGTKAASKIGAQVAKKEEEKRLEELFALEAKQEALHLPKRLVAYPKKSASQILQKSGSKKWMIAAALTAVLCLAIAYDFGAFGTTAKESDSLNPVQDVPVKPAAVAQKAFAAENARIPSHDASKPTAATPVMATNNSTVKAGPVSQSENNSVFAVSGNPASAIPTTSATITASQKAAPAANALSSRRDPDNSADIVPTKSSAPPDQSSKTVAAANNSAASQSAPADSDANTVSASVSSTGFVPAKLVHAVKPVAPSEALKNYVTGNVNVDALVETTGHIKSVTVLSGPAKLRQTAVEEMKQYLYEPAKRNGVAVVSHVQVTLQYWYEP